MRVAGNGQGCDFSLGCVAWHMPEDIQVGRCRGPFPGLSPRTSLHHGPIPGVTPSKQTQPLFLFKQGDVSLQLASIPNPHPRQQSQPSQISSPLCVWLCAQRWGLKQEDKDLFSSISLKWGFSQSQAKLVSGFVIPATPANCVSEHLLRSPKSRCFLVCCGMDGYAPIFYVGVHISTCVSFTDVSRVKGFGFLVRFPWRH